jgi:hypothetical protein
LVKKSNAVNIWGWREYYLCNYFIKFIDNEKIEEYDRSECTSCMCNYYLYDVLEIIDNKELEKIDGADDDVYIIYIKRYFIMTYSGLGR